MDFSFFEDYKEEVPSADIAMQLEDADLIAIAKNIPALHWVYDPEKGGPDDNQVDHLGIITQSLTRVPGLASAVNKDPESGIESFDSRHVAAAALALVAALARKVYNIKLDENYAKEVPTN